MTDTADKKAEVHPPGVLKTPLKPRHLKLKVSDIIIFAIIIVVIISLLTILISKVNLKHEVSQAKNTSDKAIHYMAHQDMSDLRHLGDKGFQAKNSVASLDSALTFRPADSAPITFSQLYGDTTPSVDRQIVANNSRGQHVAIIYRYTKLKVPFFVRIDTEKVPGNDNWALQALSASSDETRLLVR